MILQRRLTKILLAFSFFISCYSVVQAQHGLDTLVNILGVKFPQEKIYLHYDKSYYNAGETIWFKAYITTDNQPLAVSKTMYAELIDKKGTVLQRRTMPIVEFGAASNFDLPDSLSATTLYVRAYTAWMLNFDSTLFYLKPVTIINAKTTAQKTATTFTYKLGFFPEGGDLIENISSRLAFKATDQDGTPIAVSGTITDDAGKKITTFTSVHDGMGFVNFTPVPNVSYKAVWKDKAGLQHETALPAAKKDGVTLSVKREDNKILYTLTKPAGASDAFTAFTVIAQEHQQTIYAAKINMQVKNQVTAPIPAADSLQDGVVQITVFNNLRVPVAERLIFINNNTYYFNTDLHAVEKDLTKNAHNTLQIDVGDTLRSNLSISVTDADLNPTAANADNIFAELLLSSDLKGYVYNPAYYFSGDADSIKNSLDLVMMTNGWRRYKWENVLAEKWPVITHQPDNYLTLNGAVFGLSKTLLSGRDLTAILKTKVSNGTFLTIPIASDGRFKIEGMYFFDTARLYYQLSNDKEKKLTFSASYKFDDLYEKIPQMPSGQLATLYTPDLPNNDVIQKSNRIMAAYRLAQQNEKSKTLEVVKVRGRVKTIQEKTDEKYSTGLFAGGDAQVLVTEGDIRAATAETVLQYLQGQVAGLQVSTIGDGSLSWRGSNTDVYLDETKTDLQMIQSISMNDVAMVKIFRPPFFGSGGGGTGGAVAIYTKRGVDAARNANVKGLNTAILLGYSDIKEFYASDYSKTNESTTADNRTTLYWNPFILMDATNRRVKIPFYNSDNCKKIKVIIEGINQNGILTREEKTFE